MMSLISVQLALRVFISLTVARPLWSQIDLLSPDEARFLIRQVPEIAAARANGVYVDMSVTTLGAETFLVLVRRAIPDPNFVSSTIGNYTLDRRTGSVMLGDSALVDTPELVRLQKVLVSRLALRNISQSEALCLARLAEKTKYSTNQKRARYTIEQTSEDRTRYRFAAVTYIDEKAEVVSYLSVDRSTGMVRDEATQLPIVSGESSAVLAALIQLRFPMGLSLPNVSEIALSIPGVRERLRNTCTTLRISANGGSGDDTFVAVVDGCGTKVGSPRTEIAAVVNRQTGAVTDLIVGSTVQSPELKAMISGFFESLRGERADAQSFLRERCDSK